MISGEGKNCNGITYERMVRVFPSKKTLEYQFSYKLFFNVSGILSGEKQRVDRGYDFVGVLQVNRRPLDRQNNCNDYIQSPLGFETLDKAAALGLETSTPLTDPCQYINSNLGFRNLKI